jgi:hypothetical protein
MAAMNRIGPAKSLVLAALAASLLLGGCETLNRLNPFGGDSMSAADKKKEEAKKYDNRPVHKPTGDIPPDAANAKHDPDGPKAGR